MRLSHIRTVDLKQRLNSLTAEAVKNESILKRSQDRELMLLRAQTLQTLFAAMTEGLADSFGLEATTASFCDPDHEIRHLLMGSGSRLDELPSVQFVDNLNLLSPKYPHLHKPWLGPFLGIEHGLLFPGHAGLRSVALLPLMHEGEMVGCLNFGSADPRRFTRHHATDFLEHLATIAGFCLDSVVNRARLVQSGMTDVLTGWHNRRYLDSRIQEELARAVRFKQTVSCVLVDIDHFKAVNDNHGHLAGDQVLKEVASRMKHQVRASDVAARFGGEEFAVILPNTTLEQATQLAERMRLLVSAKPIVADDEVALTVSMSAGVSSFDGTQWDEQVNQDSTESLSTQLISQADAALYRAKAQGRNQICQANA